MKPEALLVFCAFPSIEKAREIGSILVEQSLAACVSLLPQMESIYRWQGAVQNETEVLGLIKTTRDRYEALQAKLQALHPYEVPEIMAFAASEVWEPYHHWLADGTQSQA